MQQNMSTGDRIPRIVLAGVLVIFIFNGTITGLTMYLVGALILVLKLTGVAGYCPLYTWFGINTSKKK